MNHTADTSQYKYDIEQLLATGHPIRIKPQGYSMYPLFIPGRDEAVIEPVTPDKLHRNDVALYRRDRGILVLHRICPESTVPLPDFHLAFSLPGPSVFSQILCSAAQIAHLAAVYSLIPVSDSLSSIRQSTRSMIPTASGRYRCRCMAVANPLIIIFHNFAFGLSRPFPYANIRKLLLARGSSPYIAPDLHIPFSAAFPEKLPDHAQSAASIS